MTEHVFSFRWRADISLIEGSKMEAIKEAEVHAASMFEDEKRFLCSRLEEKQLETDRYKYRIHDLEAQIAIKDSELQRTRLDLEVGVMISSQILIYHLYIILSHTLLERP